ncbi:ribosome maturation factor RimM [Paraburkholderia acidicola]|uniref:Ribosome maturation factor RimM n=1 Tax=Paraburkholderia acidicola TaxID=1912599 RepID=A0A2A4F5I7_9BURK|nr:ribosome maturation factor RimM [Paraburkholderia acidicola]PCE27834.1 ribosome maturation factor RimM [Paraburkholderia acidicola]
MSAPDSSGSGRAKAPASASEAPFGAFVRKPSKAAAPAAPKVSPDPDMQPMRVESPESWPTDAVEVGAIVDAYGLKGWVKVAAHADAGHGGDALLSAKRWWLLKGRDANPERKSTPVLQAKIHSDSIVAHLAGVDGRDAAAAMRGCRVYVSRSEFPSLKADEFYWVDLLGLDVVNVAGVALGKVADMIDNGAHSVLRVEYPATGKDGKPVNGERLIPFVGVYVKHVDQAAKQITVDWEADY